MRQLVILKLNTYDIIEITHESIISPIINRNGLYLNKKLKTCWIEYDGKAYDISHNYDFHIYELNLLNHKPLGNDEAHAMRFLYSRGLLNKDMMKLYRRDMDWKSNRNTGRNARKIRLQILGK